MGKKLGDFVHAKALFYKKKRNGQRFFFILYKHERVDIVISIFLPLDRSFYVKKTPIGVKSQPQTK